MASQNIDPRIPATSRDSSKKSSDSSKSEAGTNSVKKR